MVKIERTKSAPASLAERKSYSEDDVVTQLLHDFHYKCYICGLGKLSDINVEHLHPHHGDEDLKFAWDNLFLSCPHCNSVKNRKVYEIDIADCCLTDPETLVNQRVDSDKISVSARINTREAENTAALIEDCFELRNHGIRTVGADYRSEELRKTKLRLKKKLKAYKDPNQSEASRQRNYTVIRGMLSRKAKFSGFMRTYVRDHQNEYPELVSLVAVEEPEKKTGAVHDRTEVSV